MKKAILILLLAFSVNCSAQLLIEQDKQLHAACSFGLETICLSTDMDYTRAIVVVGGIGVLKELQDDSFDKRDLLADGIGIGSAIVFDFVFRKVFRKPNRKLLWHKRKLKRVYL